MKPAIVALARSLLIFVSTMGLIALILVLVGQFKIDNRADFGKFGIYDSALRGLPSFYNTLRMTIVNLELLTIFTMPIFLLVFRKWLRLPIVPWLLTIGFTLCCYFAFSPIITKYVVNTDFLVSSNIAVFIYMQFVMLVAILLGHLTYYGFSALRQLRFSHAQ